MGRDPGIIKIEKETGNDIYLSYERSGDRERFAYKCRILGDRIIWGSDTGRWRTYPTDSKVSFNVDGETLSIQDRFRDGTAISKSFSAGCLSDQGPGRSGGS